MGRSHLLVHFESNSIAHLSEIFAAVIEVGEQDQMWDFISWVTVSWNRKISINNKYLTYFPSKKSFRGVRKLFSVLWCLHIVWCGEDQILEYIWVAVIKINNREFRGKNSFDTARAGLFNCKFPSRGLTKCGRENGWFVLNKLLLGQHATPLKSEKLEMPWLGGSAFNSWLELQMNYVQSDIITAPFTSVYFARLRINCIDEKVR